MELPWQAPNKASLAAAVEAGRLPHAILLSAYPGWGAAELGAWLALQVLQHRRAVDARQLAHPDFRWLAPERGRIPLTTSADCANSARAPRRLRRPRRR